MSKPLSLNVLAQYADSNALLGWVAKAQPDALLIMDSIALALAVRQRSPQTTVVYRAYNPNDHQWWKAATPGDWLAAHKPFALNGVVVQCLNEPTLDDDGRAWLSQIIVQCPPDMRLALPNFAVGNPSEKDIAAGRYDWLLTLVCGSRHIFALHEYFMTHPGRGGAEYPFLCGRFEYWVERALALGLPKPRIVITEHGRDHGGGIDDGWRGQGWTDETYYSLLAQARSLYAPHNIPVCVFCYGRGAGGRWRSFDVQDAPALLTMMANYGEKDAVPDIPAPTTGGVKAKLIRIPADFVNVRHQPNGNDVGDLLVGDVVTYYPAAKQGDWVYQTPVTSVPRQDGRQNAAAGWVSLQGGKVEFAAVVEPTPDPEPTPAPPPAEETVEIAISDLNATLIDLENAVARLRGVKQPASGEGCLLNVPYVSQRGSDADISNNDCGIASLLMLFRYRMLAMGFLVPDVPTVDDLVKYTPLAGDPKALMSFADIIALAKRIGAKAQHRMDMTPDIIKAHIANGTPVMALVDYSAYYLGGAKIPHLIVVTGYDKNGFVTHDPYLLGQGKHVSVETLDAAMTIVPQNSGSHQGLVLAA